MKSYSQFSEGVEEVRLKEWEKLDEGTKKEIIKQFAEENNIEFNEEELNEVVATTAIATSPIWGPALKTAAVAGTAYLASKAPGWIKKHNQNKEMERWLETGKFESSNIPKSNRTDKQRDETAKREKDRINKENLTNKNNKEEIKNQRESEKINKQLQNRNENPNNPNKKPGFGKRFKNFIKNHPKTSLLGGLGTGYVGGVALDKAARNSGVIPDNRDNIKNNNNNNNNSNSNTYDPTLDPKNKNKFK